MHGGSNGGGQTWKGEGWAWGAVEQRRRRAEELHTEA